MAETTRTEALRNEVAIAEADAVMAKTARTEAAAEATMIEIAEAEAAMAKSAMSKNARN